MSSDEKKTSQIETYQLSHPELLSEETLHEILKNRCIALPDFGAQSKAELVETFRRIALPMPQRTYNESRNLGRMLSDLRTKRGVKTADYSENAALPQSSQPGDAKGETRCSGDGSAKDRLKPPIGDNQQTCKKIRLSNSSNAQIVPEKDAKRKCEVSTLEKDLKKRQKITWP